MVTHCAASSTNFKSPNTKAHKSTKCEFECVHISMKWSFSFVQWNWRLKCHSVWQSQKRRNTTIIECPFFLSFSVNWMVVPIVQSFSTMKLRLHKWPIEIEHVSSIKIIGVKVMHWETKKIPLFWNFINWLFPLDCSPSIQIIQCHLTGKKKIVSLHWFSFFLG